MARTNQQKVTDPQALALVTLKKSRKQMGLTPLLLARKTRGPRLPAFTQPIESRTGGAGRESCCLQASLPAAVPLPRPSLR